MLVKICGIKSLDDAIISSSFYPDYLGLIFCDSPRKINIATAKKIVNSLNNKKFIGVFQNNPIEEVLEIAKICNLFGIQLHGEEDPNDIEIIKENKFLAIKAFRIESSLPENLSEYKPDYFLFDKVKGVKNLNTDALKSYNLNVLFFIAGGLSSENVIETIQKISNPKFCGIDLASGVERENKKDPILLNNFFNVLKKQNFFGGQKVE
ncbi:Phosphoribosylanthranilate isomerase [Thermodesulfobium narugense DSM 14796]|uniref:N-(5'-phosphoribosyl)anthranilate isomerase n=1 Tax=Thermodesulfobium narugense DSM 14796 TaxID=747365 RepID=M1E8X9_9BACT|nr:phosphoribosylanthranilate isomerase [Thermodesulfobium narugense]AEE15448.1 Phosphoribosylanthranilate isomerase [Thermodesulfobium narugense DSM 14796]